MKILIYLHHPAHFHLFKNVISSLQSKHELIILATKKDILEQLLANANIPYQNILPEGRKDNKVSIALGLLKQDIRLLKMCLQRKPDLLVGTSTEITHIGRALRIPSIFVNEDDIGVIPLVGKLAYPFAEILFVPDCCDVGKFKNKLISYAGYHELAYLHPDNFIPKGEIVDQYFDFRKRFFLMRFAKLGAHHDFGIQGIDSATASRVIEILKPHGDIYIFSERELEPEFERFRIQIDPLDMHHVMAHAAMFIGDSQTMAAEAGVLGTPFVRFNDFVGRIGYLNELENKYKLGFGIKPDNSEALLSTINSLVRMENLKPVFSERRRAMLKDKIDVAQFMTWFIEKYPASVKVMRESPDYQYRFRSELTPNQQEASFT